MANFQNLTIRWIEIGKVKGIQGDPTLCKSRASWKATLKALKDDGEGYFITSSEYFEMNDEGMVLLSAIQQLLEEFEDFAGSLWDYHHLGSMTAPSI